MIEVSSEHEETRTILQQGGAIGMRNGRSNFVFVRGVVNSTFPVVYKENKTPLDRGGYRSARRRGNSLTRKIRHKYQNKFNIAIVRLYY